MEQTTTMTLVDFLTARLAEDEATARANGQDPEADYDYEAFEADLGHQQPHGARCGWRLGEGMIDECECGYPARVLREVEAKRRVVALHVDDWDEDPEGRRFSVGCYVCCNQSWPCPTLRALASVYADHPDYDPAWA